MISRLENRLQSSRWCRGDPCGTVFMAYQASHLPIDAGFAKLLPLKHEYMQTYVQYRDSFGGANRVVIALRVREGDIFTPEFFDVLQTGHR